MRGFFRMDYARGGGGAGGTVVFTDGAVAGWDTGGCFFRGSYTQSGSGIAGELTMDFPNGGTAVDGANVSKGAQPRQVPFDISNVARPEEMRLRTDAGDIGVKLTKVSGL